jgi:hypothetical protein
MGTLNIIDWCAVNGNPKPVWRGQAGSLYHIFQPAVMSNGQQQTIQAAGEVPGEVPGEVAG